MCFQYHFGLPLYVFNFQLPVKRCRHVRTLDYTTIVVSGRVGIPITGLTTPVPSLHIYTSVVSRAFMVDAASQAGDADSSQAPDLTSNLQGSVNVPPWCSIVGATVTVHQFFCILYFHDIALLVKNRKFIRQKYCMHMMWVPQGFNIWE